MQYLRILVIASIVVSMTLMAYPKNLVLGQPISNQPVISEIEIPNMMNLTLGNQTPVHSLNISYTFNDEERYVLLNITHFKQSQFETDDCIRSSVPMEENQTAFQCISRDSSLGTSTTFCSTNTADCVQPSSRHTK